MFLVIPFMMMAQNNEKPKILIIWGDDIGQSNISAYTFGMMVYKTVWRYETFGFFGASRYNKL